MYKELVERLRKMYTLCAWDELKNAADAIETIGICWADSKRYAGKLEHENLMLRIELDRLKRERDQAVEELHRNTDAVPVVRCKDCIKWEADESYEFDDDGTKKLWVDCSNSLHHCKDNHYCNYGERKESNE